MYGTTSIVMGPMSSSDDLEFLSDFLDEYAATRVDRYYLASWTACRSGATAPIWSAALDRDELAAVARAISESLSDGEQLIRLRVLDAEQWQDAIEAIRAVIGNDENDLRDALEEVVHELLKSTPPADVA